MYMKIKVICKGNQWLWGLHDGTCSTKDKSNKHRLITTDICIDIDQE